MRNAKTGAAVGSLLSTAYVLCIVTWLAIKGSDISLVIPEILIVLFSIAILSAFIGGITGLVFGLVLKKFKSNITNYTIICIVISFLIVAPFNLSYLNWILDVKYWDGHTTGARNDLFFLIVIPSILYVITSGFVSRYLYKINKTNEANSVS